VSCDFKVHPAALNNIGMWERHDRDKFELIAISYGEEFAFGRIAKEGVLAKSWYSNVRSCLIRDLQFSKWALCAVEDEASNGS
jgi:hypothetical protein